MLGHLIPPRDTQVDATFTDEGGYVSCREEDQRYVMVLYQCNVETGFPAELDIGTGKEVERRLLQTAL